MTRAEQSHVAMATVQSVVAIVESHRRKFCQAAVVKSVLFSSGVSVGLLCSCTLQYIGCPLYFSLFVCLFLFLSWPVVLFIAEGMEFGVFLLSDPSYIQPSFAEILLYHTSFVALSGLLLFACILGFAGTLSPALLSSPIQMLIPSGSTSRNTPRNDI